MRALASSMSSGDASSSARLQRVAGAHRLALDPERDAAAQPERHIPRRVSGVAVILDQRPGGWVAAVVEVRLAPQLHLDRALETEHDPDQQVVRVFVSRGTSVRRDLVLAEGGADRERLAYHRPARRRVPGGVEDVRAGLVDPCGRDVDSERAEPE